MVSVTVSPTFLSLIHICLGAADDGERGVHAAGNADDRVLEIGILHTAHEAGGLHVQQALGRGVIIRRVVRAVGVLAERAGEHGLLSALAPLGDDVGRSVAGEGRVLAARGDEMWIRDINNMPPYLSVYVWQRTA